MPAISSAQLSDISERTEYTTKPDLDHEKHRQNLRRHSEFVQSAYTSDEGAASPDSVIENPKINVQNSMKNEIEINIHKASTISEE